MLSRKALLIATAVVGIAIIVFLSMNLPHPKQFTERTIFLPVAGESTDEADGIPIPFLSGTKGSSLQGSLTKVAEYTTGSGLVLYRVRFTDTGSAILREKDGVKSNLFLVDTTNVPGFTGTKKIPYEPRLVLTAVDTNGNPSPNLEAVDVYGYQYSNTGSTLEKAASHQTGATFVQRFPSFFFRSREATRLHSGDLDAFASAHGIRWFRMDTAPEAQSVTDPVTTAIRFKPNTLTLLIVSQNVKMTVNPAPFCGNGWLQGSEQCDDGNTVNGDGCSSACAVEPRFMCTGIPSVCQRTPNLFVTQKISTDTATHQHLIGQNGALSLLLSLRSTTGTVKISSFNFTIDGTGSGSVDALNLYNRLTPGTLLVTALPRGTGAGCPSSLERGTFCAVFPENGRLQVEPGTPVDLLVRPAINAALAGAGKQFTIKLKTTDLDTTATVTPSVVAFPSMSGSTMLPYSNGNAIAEGELFIGTAVPAANVALSGSGQDIVSAKVASIGNGSSVLSGSALPIGSDVPVGEFSLVLTPESTLAQFRPQAVIFDVESRYLALSNFTLTWQVIVGSGSSSITGTACTAKNAANVVLSSATGNYFVSCPSISQAGLTSLAAGQLGKFILLADTSVSPAVPSQAPTLRVSISAFTNPKATAVDIAAGQSHIKTGDLRNGSSIFSLWLELLTSVVRSTQYSGPFCSNGRIEASEQCDDGNLVAGDRCSPLCTLEGCGDGYIDVNGPDNIAGNADDEQCDDGNTNNDDECSNACKSNVQLPLGR